MWLTWFWRELKLGLLLLLWLWRELKLGLLLLLWLCRCYRRGDCAVAAAVVVAVAAVGAV
jgi:hypothetical protein